MVHEPHSGLLCSGSFDGTIKLWSLNTGELKYTLVRHDSYVYSLVALRDAVSIVSASFDGTLCIWNTANGELVKQLNEHSSRVYSLLLLKNGDMASASSDRSIKIWT